MSSPEIVIVGGGVAAIALAHTLKCKLGFKNFVIYDKRSGLGGTWRVNTYPGCGSDVPIHLYSFSFNLNPDWTQALADQEEILRYIEATVDKFDLRSHFVFNTECKGAEWKEDHWELQLSNTREESSTFTKSCQVFIPAVGGFSQPRWTKFQGMDSFQGKIFHTADWDHTFDWVGKRVAIIGNGCSAAQVVPSIAPGVKRLTQYARSAQWYHPRPNKIFTSWDKFCFRYIPFYQRWHRLDLFLQTDQLASVYGSDSSQIRKRKATEEESRKYIYEETPQKYHDFIAPDFPLGCKRRIYDPGYLASLHRDNVELLPEGIREITETGVVSEKGSFEEVDAIILATGFQVTSFLAPMRIVTKNGKTLQEQWDAHRGAQAYMGTFVHNCPNLGILFGPNTFPAFNSVIYAIEVQVDYLANVLLKPIIDGRLKVLEVKKEAEEKFVLDLDRTLDETVFAAGCSNWYINSAGRNSAAWPGLAATFWKAAWWPKRSDFVSSGGSVTWPLYSLARTVTTSSPLVWAATAASIVQLYRLSCDPSVDFGGFNNLKDLFRGWGNFSPL